MIIFFLVTLSMSIFTVIIAIYIYSHQLFHSNLLIIFTADKVSKSETVGPIVIPPVYDRYPLFHRAIAFEERQSSQVKTLLFLLLIILISLSCVSVVGIVWFGPRWPTYEITYTLRRYLLKIGVPLQAILFTLSVFITIVIGICIYLCFGNP